MATPQRADGCPKHMVYGPCGGVRADLGCEVHGAPCPFVDSGPIPYLAEPSDVPFRQAPPSSLITTSRSRPVVLTDLTVRPFDVASVARIGEVLGSSCDAVLVGEHQNRPDFPPVLMAGLLADAGVRAWITLSCRDRNRLVLEQELAGLQQTDVDGVLCVTGDARAPGIRPGATQVFDLDGTRLAALAAGAGLNVAVPESPGAPRRKLRAARLLEKQRAGAQLAVLNHVRDAQALADFVAQAHAVGVTIPLIASVAVFTDDRSGSVLLRFPGFDLDQQRVSDVLSAPDPVAAGIAAAAREAQELLAIEGVVGVNVSGLASDRGEVYAAEIKATLGHAIKEL